MKPSRHDDLRQHRRMVKIYTRYQWAPTMYGCVLIFLFASEHSAHAFVPSSPKCV
jgi:hypothetical protein